MSSVRYESIDKGFGDVAVIEDLHLSIADGEFVVFLGPSGCGKTTLLRLLAGLDEPTAGRIWIGERDVTDLPPKQRNIAMVFQNYALYPHMTVAQNIAFGLKLRGLPRTERDAAVRKAASMLGLEDLLGRRPRQLSGGQRQRVAMGRAIVRDPDVFLMDEPLSNLDAQLRNQMRIEISALQKRLGATTVYVTHDQVEAMTMADRIVVLLDGRIQQVGAPDAVYESPANRFVAGFVGAPAMNFLTAERRDDGRLRLPGGLEPDLPEALRHRLQDRRRVVIGIRPERLGPVNGSHPDAVRWRSPVTVAETHGADVLLHFAVDTMTLRAKVAREDRLREGDAAEFGFRLCDAHVFDAEDGRAL